MRATTSTPPPGANGTSRRIGRVGYCAWACACGATVPMRSKIVASARSRNPIAVRIREQVLGHPNRIRPAAHPPARGLQRERRRPDRGEAKPPRQRVDDRDGDEDHGDEDADLVPFVETDLLGELQADAAGADDADDGGRA